VIDTGKEGEKKAPFPGPLVVPLVVPLAATLRAGRPEEAFSLCERVLAAEPDNADALNLAGVTSPTWPR